MPPKRAKENADAAKRLSDIEDAQKSESEKVAERLAKADAEVATVPENPLTGAAEPLAVSDRAGAAPPPASPPRAPSGNGNDPADALRFFIITLGTLLAFYIRPDAISPGLALLPLAVQAGARGVATAARLARPGARSGCGARRRW